MLKETKITISGEWHCHLFLFHLGADRLVAFGSRQKTKSKIIWNWQFAVYLNMYIYICFYILPYVYIAHCKTLSYCIMVFSLLRYLPTLGYCWKNLQPDPGLSMNIWMVEIELTKQSAKKGHKHRHSKHGWFGFHLAAMRLLWQWWPLHKGFQSTYSAPWCKILVPGSMAEMNPERKNKGRNWAGIFGCVCVCVGFLDLLGSWRGSPWWNQRFIS